MAHVRLFMRKTGKLRKKRFRKRRPVAERGERTETDDLLMDALEDKIAVMVAEQAVGF